MDQSDCGDGESGERFHTFLKLFENLSSRRMLLGSGLGAMATALALKPDTFLDPVEAAPQDVRGSKNIFVKAFHNKKGQFRLCSDGSIVDSKGNWIEENTNSRWPLNKKYPRPNPARGHPAGSPWVAVDVVQDTEGTHVLFADGSVRTPNVDAVKAPPVAELQVFTLFDPSPEFRVNGAIPYYQGMTKNGFTYTFDVPFKEVPHFLYFEVLQGDTKFYCTGHNLVSPRFQITKSYLRHAGFSNSRANVMALIIGEIDVEG